MPNPNIWKPDYGLKAIVANSTTFQSTVGAANASAAMAHIFSSGDDDFDEARAVVNTETMRRYCGGVGGIGNWKSKGTIVLLLERKSTGFEISDKTTFDSQESSFTQWCSDVWLEMETLLDLREAITIGATSYNPLAVAEVHSDGKAYLMPESETPQLDESDPDTPTARKNRSWWWMQFFIELY